MESKGKEDIPQVIVGLTIEEIRQLNSMPLEPPSHVRPVSSLLGGFVDVAVEGDSVAGASVLRMAPEGFIRLGPDGSIQGIS